MYNEIGELIRIIRRRLLIFVISIVVLVACVFPYISRIPLQYTTTAVFEYEQKQPLKMLMVVDQRTLVNVFDKSIASDLILKIRSDSELYKAILKRLNEEPPVFESDSFIALASHYTFNAESDRAGLVRVTFTSSNPDLCYSAVKIFLEEFERLDTKRDLIVLKKAQLQLQESLTAKKNDLSEMYVSLSEESKSGEEEEVVGYTPEEIRLGQVRSYLKDIEKSRDSIRAYNEMRVLLSNLQNQLQQEKIKYTENSSTIIRLKGQMAKVSSDVERYENELGSILFLSEPELRREEAGLKDRVGTGQPARVELSADKTDSMQQNFSEIAVKKEEIMTLNKKLDDLSVVESTLDQYIKVMWEPQKQATPLLAERNQKKMLCLIACFCLSLLACVAVEWMDDRIVNSDEVESIVGGNIIVDIPTNATTMGNVEALVKSGLDYFFQVVTFVRASMPDEDAFSIFVTSSRPGEGKSTISSGLALAMSETSKTIIVDCDFRDPDIKRLFDISGDKGILQVLLENVPVEEAISHTTNPNLDVLPCIRGIINPGNIFLSQKFDSLIKHLTGEYDVVIIDTPPVSAAPDVFALGALGAKGIMVVDISECRKTMLKRSVKFLRTFKMELLGVVVNKQVTGMGHGYYSNYNSSYSTSRKTNDKMASSFADRINRE